MQLIRILAGIVILICACAAQSKMRTDRVSYRIGVDQFEASLVYDDQVKTKRPGLVMIPNWMGINAAQIEKAKTIAGKDYVILVADVYSTKVRPTNPDQAGAAAKAMYADRTVLRARVNESLSQLRLQAKRAPIDLKKLGAIGFCFGGASAIELARSGADIAGVVSFHGNLSSDNPNLAKNMKAKVLALNGADDAYVPVEQIAAFQKEMQDAKADWQFVNLGGAVHCFAEPDAKGEVPGCVYNERAATRSFAMMRAFFEEVFAK